METLLLQCVTAALYTYLSVRPVSLSILTKPSFVSAQVSFTVTCQAIGGYPPPRLSWWLGSKKLTTIDKEVSLLKSLKAQYSMNTNLLQASRDGVSKSILKFKPRVSDDGRYLTCRAENAALHGTTMEDQWHLRVHCK